MAEVGGAAQAPPTFKLVLVGDGGTGKVSCFFLWHPACQSFSASRFEADSISSTPSQQEARMAKF